MLYYRVLYSLTRSLRPAWLHATAQFFAMHSSPCSTLLLHSTLNNNKTRSIRGQCGLRSGTCNCIQFPSFFLSKAHCGQARKGAWEERALFFSQAVSFTSFSFFVPEPVQLCGHVKTQRRDILNGALCAPVFFVVAFFPSYTYYFVVEAHHGCWIIWRVYRALQKTAAGRCSQNARLFLQHLSVMKDGSV